MAFGKAIPANDVVNGAAVVSTGERTRLYDNAQRTEHIPNPAATATAQNIDKRYRYHGGPGGSGNWEH